MLGVPVRLRDARTLDDLGIAHAPARVAPGDVVSLEHGPPLRILVVLVPLPGAPVPVIVRPVPFALASR